MRKYNKNIYRYMFIAVVVALFCSFNAKALENALWDNYVASRKAYEANKTPQTADKLWKAYTSLMSARTQPFLDRSGLIAKNYVARAATIWKQEAYKRMQQFSQDPLLITKFYPFLTDWVKKEDCQAQLNALKKEMISLKKK